MGTAEWFDGVGSSDDTSNVGFIPPMKAKGRQARKATPPFGPDDIRQMASDALKMQDALIRIQSILKRPAPTHQSLAMHHAYMLRDIHKAVNLPEPESVKRILSE